VNTSQRIVRPALHAGTWYPNDRKAIEEFVQTDRERQKAVAVVCPHAGWTYSGKVAGEVFSSVEPADLYVLIGPNHRGTGAAISVFPEGSWQTPLGNLDVDRDIAAAIIEYSGIAQPDTAAHIEEHSLEVELPFVKYFSPNALIVPVALADYRLRVCRNLGESVARAITADKRALKILLVASTDMSHYIPAEDAKKVDALAIDRILRLDPSGLLKTVSDNDISMCGSGPTAAVLFAARALGAKTATLVRYTSSGEVTGDNDQVVAYAGIIIQ